MAEELRYPWANAWEFFSNGYWLEFGALHLSIGWAFIIWITFRVLSIREIPIEFGFASLYFSLTIYSNGAYSIAGLNVNELFGLFAIFSLLIQGRIPFARTKSLAAIGLLALFFVSILHNIVTTVAYPSLLPDFLTLVTKVAVNFKIFVLAANISIVSFCIARRVGLNNLIVACIEAAMIAQLLYLLQLFIFISGFLPYGTYVDAGFVGFPSFGSVSIERGHMGKFIAPYFAFFLFALLHWRWYFRFLLFLTVSAINFSASGQVFFLFSLLLAVFVFYRNLGLKAVGLITLCVFGFFGFAISYWAVFEAIIEKIISLAILGDETAGGGRSVGVLFEYISQFPLGIGYSGSTLRTVPGLPEINAAFFAFISQYSFLSFPILICFLLLTVSAARSGLQSGILGRCMAVGVFMAPIIFFVDVLWFVPMVWLPAAIILALRKGRGSSLNQLSASAEC